MRATRTRPSPTLRARYAALLLRLRYPILAFWVAAAVAATLVLPSVDEAQLGRLGDLVPHNSDAVAAEEHAHELFGFPLLSRTVIVQRSADGLSRGAQLRVLARAHDLNRHLLPDLERIAGAIPITNAFGKPPFSRERSTTALTFLFFEPSVGLLERQGLTGRLKDLISEPGDALVGSTGAVSARQEQASLVRDALPIVEIATVALVLLAVGLHFRSVVAPLLNLATVAIAYLISIRLIAFIGQKAGVSVPREVTPVIVVLLFGVITDYSIFFLSRFRRLLADGRGRRAAMQETVGDIAPIVLAAGLSVVVASGALLVAQLGFLQAFGPGMALAVLVGLVVALTLLPAMLAIGGPLVFWPRRPRAHEPAPAADDEAPAGDSRPLRTWAVRRAVERPAVVAAACVLLLLAAASGLRHLDAGNPLVRGLPDDNPVKVAYHAASQGFTPGLIAPTVVVVEGPGITERRAELERLQRLLGSQRGVAKVAGPASVPFRIDAGAALSPTGDAARYVVVLKADPLGARAIEAVNRIERRMPELLDAAGLPAAKASFAGDTALVAETVDKTFGDLGRVAPVTVLAVLVVLALFLRALVAPLYLVAASILAVAAALGITAYVFVDVLGQGGITYYVPFTASVLLVALGSDYNVFIVGRIWQEARRRPLREAVLVGGARAARPITVAGVILGLSFALLAIVPLQSFREIAFAMTAGLLIDAFLVRTLLVPALIVLFGYSGGWPGRQLAGGRGSPAASDPRDQARTLAR